MNKIHSKTIHKSQFLYGNIHFLIKYLALISYISIGATSIGYAEDISPGIEFDCESLLSKYFDIDSQNFKSIQCDVYGNFNLPFLKYFGFSQSDINSSRLYNIFQKAYKRLYYNSRGDIYVSKNLYGLADYNLSLYEYRIINGFLDENFIGNIEIWRSWFSIQNKIMNQNNLRLYNKIDYIIFEYPTYPGYDQYKFDIIKNTIYYKHLNESRTLVGKAIILYNSINERLLPKEITVYNNGKIINEYMFTYSNINDFLFINKLEYKYWINLDNPIYFKYYLKNIVIEAP